MVVECADERDLFMNDLTGSVAITLTLGASSLRGRWSCRRPNIVDMLIAAIGVRAAFRRVVLVADRRWTLLRLLVLLPLVRLLLTRFRPALLLPARRWVRVASWQLLSELSLSTTTARACTLLSPLTVLTGTVTMLIQAHR
jgi:hypothetical protein